MAQASPTFADSDPGDEFSNDLFSDLAPLLVLFGEQVAMQFIAESLDWADIIIFSMAPVGRTKENIAVAESQLMSSTSDEVCEVFNGRHVVRLMGKPSIKELIFMKGDGFAAGRDAARQVDRFLATSKALEEEYLITTDFPGYPTFEQLRERVKSGNDLSHNEIRQHNHRDPKRGSIRPLVMTLDRERLRAISQHSPNISLNVHPRDGRSELHVVAALGIFLQLGVLVFD
ncbi:hypothetical protein DFP73DRAFT_529418 [Morchella snyderi]|nr:hypothetical protein DFP73DRAFT_529418 [Morchella snyderi]